MKAWAIKTPKGRIIAETVDKTRGGAWWQAECLEGEPQGLLESFGYRAVKVTITEGWA